MVVRTVLLVASIALVGVESLTSDPTPITATQSVAIPQRQLDAMRDRDRLLTPAELDDIYSRHRAVLEQMGIDVTSLPLP